MQFTRLPDHLWHPAFLSFSLALMMIGCADDAKLGDDEVGETGDNGDGDGDGDIPNLEPMDPLKGGGGIPPATEDPTKSWPAATTLGNGLVHDSRLNREETLYQRNYLDTDLANGVRWSDFVGSYQDRITVGFRPAQLQARIAAVPTSGVTTKLAIIDDSVYVSDDDANYQTEVETYLFDNVPTERNFANFAPAALGARPVSIDTFAIQNSGKVGYSVAWAYDDTAMPWMIVAGQSTGSMMSKLDELDAEGFRPISIASRWRGQDHEYAAIFVKDGMPSVDCEENLGIDAGTLETEIQTKWAAGFYPIRVTGARGSSLLNALWVRRPPGISVQVRLNLIPETFESEDANWRTRGYHLESVADYEDAEQARKVAVWVRYEPFLRWQGTTFAPNDPTYQSRYAMFHDQAIRTMSFATEVDCSGGQPCPGGTSCYECPDDDTVCFHDDVCVESKFGKLLRPSATLHLFEGDDLVLTRAYTFAPAIYPSTPLNASMRLASVSKSITAAAVVREMAEHSIDLTTPFNTLAGIEGAPAAMDAVTVLDVLRNRGGFTSGAKSYANHTVIDDSIFGTIPIDGTEMFDYVIAGHLGVGGDDNYWDLALYESSQSEEILWYSNPGFSMLGELLRVLSGSSYEGYVTNKLFEPVGLSQTSFSEVGHRVHDHGATLAGLRAYLVNRDHPYHLKPLHQALAQGNCDTLQGWKWDGTTCSALLGCGCTGPDCVHLYESQSSCESDHRSPRFESESLPKPLRGDRSMTWADNVGPLDSAAPDRASRARYSGDFYMGGAPLAAGGWHADGESLGALIRAISQTEVLMPSGVSSELWSPQWWNRKGSPAGNWSYGLGWYIRGNWVAWAGGAEGSMATVLHNRAHDFTVVYLTNTHGNGINEFMDPLMVPSAQTWDTSSVGAAFPCLDDPQTAANECSTLTVPY